MMRLVLNHGIRTILFAVSIFSLIACGATPPVFTNNPKAEDKIVIIPSKYIDRIEDKRPDYQKNTRLLKTEEIDIQLLGDNVFLNSPLNEIASAVSTWAIRNPGSKILINSLLIHYGAEEIRPVEPVTLPESLTDTVAHSEHVQEISSLEMAIGIKLAELLISRMEHEMAPGGYTVVVYLEASVAGEDIMIKQIQAPVHEETPRETVAAALNNAGYKLSRHLLQ